MLRSLRAAWSASPLSSTVSRGGSLLRLTFVTSLPLRLKEETLTGFSIFKDKVIDRENGGNYYSLDNAGTW